MRIYSNITNDLQKVETTQILSVDEWIKNVVYLCNRIYLAIKKDWITTTW